jgi:hypothetical protein
LCGCLQGRVAQLYDLAAVQAWQAQWLGQHITPFLYPPAYSLFFLPLALLPAQIARGLWLVIGLAAALLAARWSMRWSGLSYPLSVLGLLAFPALAYSLAVGQMTPVLLLLFTAIASLEFQEKDGYLPGFLGGLALFKPQLVLPLLVYWLFSRRWRSVVGFLAAGLVIGGLSSLLSPAGSLAYLRLSLDFFNLAQTASQRGANASLFAISPWVGVLAGIAILGTIALASRKPITWYTYAMLWLAPVLASPYLVTYDLLSQAGIALLYLAALLAIPLMSVRPVIWVGMALYLVCAWRTLRPGKRADDG